MTSRPPSAPDGINATVLGTLSASLLFSVVSVHVKTSGLGRDGYHKPEHVAKLMRKNFKVVPCAVMGKLVSAPLDNALILRLNTSETLQSDVPHVHCVGLHAWRRGGMSSCCSEWTVCSSICTSILRVSTGLCSASSGLCRPRGLSTLSTPGASCPSRFSEVNSYSLELGLFDAFTLGTENCAGDHRSFGLAVKDWQHYQFSSVKMCRVCSR